MHQIQSIVDTPGNSMPILIVGTHADKLSDLQKEQVLAKISKLYPKSTKLTGVQGHFAVSLRYLSVLPPSFPLFSPFNVTLYIARFECEDYQNCGKTLSSFPSFSLPPLLPLSHFASFLPFFNIRFQLKRRCWTALGNKNRGKNPSSFPLLHVSSLLPF